jgi:hypothetical protein
MGEVTIIGVDLAKNVFQLYGPAADGRPGFRKMLSRSRLGEISRLVVSRV